MCDKWLAYVLSRVSLESVGLVKDVPVFEMLEVAQAVQKDSASNIEIVFSMLYDVLCCLISVFVYIFPVWNSGGRGRHAEKSGSSFDP